MTDPRSGDPPPHPAAPPPSPGPKLNGPAHEAVLAAAERPDHLVPGISSAAYWAKERWFNARTLAVVYRAGYADIRPQPWDQGPVTWNDTGRDLYLTPAGRVYAGWHTARPVGRRRIVIVSGVRAGSRAVSR
ncbi:hypothetical protein VSR01_27990 [Actinacidiphila sp. DG2A-62]|uniref:hypothetical protein n=1 Tax=Actinacidiphila sp. DG2A-62 TaxID=3108821 RepID=UPI002DB9B600|nr:hypothetical protein [Actinacidiphila sp. DG2A-62]MEC3997134.1 hypothetical protein [Actinacidiphila sp. DG2A-62]